MSGIFHRVSVRKYQDRPIEPEKIDLLLRAAMQAPSACNQQPWDYYVVTNKEMIEKLSQVHSFSGCAAEAPVVFVACYHKKGIVPAYFHLDMSASVQNLLIEADELGLGAVWLGIAPDRKRMDRLHQIMDLPEEVEGFAVIPCGYPAEEHAQESRFHPERVHYID